MEVSAYNASLAVQIYGFIKFLGLHKDIILSQILKMNGGIEVIIGNYFKIIQRLVQA